VAATNVAIRKYHEDTPAVDVNIIRVAVAMKISTKDTTDKPYKKLSKIVFVANPTLGDDWLQGNSRAETLFFVC